MILAYSSFQPNHRYHISVFIGVGVNLEKSSQSIKYTSLTIRGFTFSILIISNCLIDCVTFRSYNSVLRIRKLGSVFFGHIRSNWIHSYALQAINLLVYGNRSDFFHVLSIDSNYCMNWERFLHFERILFRFHFRVGISLWHHNFGREFSNFNLYEFRCKFAKERRKERVYFPNNPRTH